MWRMLFSSTGLVVLLGGTLAFKLLRSKKKSKDQDHDLEKRIYANVQEAIRRGWHQAKAEEDHRGIEDDSYM